MAAKSKTEDVLKEFAVGNNQFSADVFKRLLPTSTGNLLVCPLSAEIILALVHAGAEGKTAEELSNALYLPKTPEKINRTFKQLQILLQSNEYYTVSSANKVYVKDGCKIIEKFKNTAVETFLAEIQNIDFEQTHDAASEINRWVEEKTHDKIKDMVNPSELDEETRMMLINAMYFNGTWTSPFHPYFTEKKLFYVSNVDQVNVDMMEKTNYFDYYEDSILNAKFLSMPYKGDVFTMIIVLPNDKDGLADLETHIVEALVIPKYSREVVHVEIPKFKIESTVEFIPILQALGIVDAFNNDANFSGMLDKVNSDAYFSGMLDKEEVLNIDEVLQKTFIEVNEQGTTAAAATRVRLVGGCGRVDPPKEFLADHPFIFYLKIKDVIFFIGRCVSPKY